MFPFSYLDMVSYVAIFTILKINMYTYHYIYSYVAITNSIYSKGFVVLYTRMYADPRDFLRCLPRPLLWCHSDFQASQRSQLIKTGL